MRSQYRPQHDHRVISYPLGESSSNCRSIQAEVCPVWYSKLWLDVLYRNTVLRRVFDYPAGGVVDGVPLLRSSSRPKPPT